MAEGDAIRSDDDVIVIGGKDRGKTRPRDPHRAREALRVFVEGLNMIKRHQRPRSVKDAAEGRRGRRDHREGGPDPRLQRDAARPRGQQAHPRAASSRDGRQAQARRRAHRKGSGLSGSRDRTAATGRPAAAAARALRAGGQAGADRAVRLLDARWQVPTPREDHPQHGRRRGQAEHPDARGRARSSSRRSPASSPSVRRRASRSPTSRCARGCRSASP